MPTSSRKEAPHENMAPESNFVRLLEDATCSANLPICSVHRLPEPAGIYDLTVTLTTEPVSIMIAIDVLASWCRTTVYHVETKLDRSWKGTLWYLSSPAWQ